MPLTPIHSKREPKKEKIHDAGAFGVVVVVAQVEEARENELSRVKVNFPY